MNKEILVLIVEDELSIQKAVAAMFEMKNVETVTARSVDEAKQIVENTNKIDAIWLDHYLLGKGTGLDFLAWCKQDRKGKYTSIPCYVVTNTASADQLATYIHFGVAKYYVKADHRLDEIVNTVIEGIRNPSTMN